MLSVDINTLLYQVPGGMLSNLINQLKQANASDKFYDVLAEIPRVREDFGYPPLVTPTSQIVGTQAVMNVLAGERYKMNPKESQALMRGEYGRLPAKVNEEVRRKVIGDAKSSPAAPPTCWSRKTPRSSVSAPAGCGRMRMCSPTRCSRRWPRSSSSGAIPRPWVWTIRSSTRTPRSCPCKPYVLPRPRKTPRPGQSIKSLRKRGSNQK